MIQILVQQKRGGAFLDNTGGWERVAHRARVFPSVLAAMDYCLRRQLWAVNLVVKVEPPGHDVAISLARSMESSIRPDTVVYDR